MYFDPRKISLCCTSLSADTIYELLNEIILNFSNMRKIIETIYKLLDMAFLAFDLSNFYLEFKIEAFYYQEFSTKMKI